MNQPEPEPICIHHSTHGLDGIGFARGVEQLRIKAAVGAAGLWEIQAQLEFAEVEAMGEC